MQANVDVIDTLKNGAYYTGESKIFYKNILNYGAGTPVFDNSFNATFNATGRLTMKKL